MNIAITGANVGIGVTTAEEAARAGAAYIAILCRNPTTAAEAEKSIKAAATNPKFRVKSIACDLGDLKTIGKAALELAKENVKLDLLILNAGVMMTPEKTTTVDGFETQMGVNHFGHFLLTDLIRKADLLKENARVVALSSMAHRQFGGFDIHDLNFDRRPYSSAKSYGASKAANIMFIQELQRQFDAEGKGRVAVAVHPGFVRTKLMRESSWIRILLFLLYPLYWAVSLSPVEGVQCTLHAATTPNINTIKGSYLENLRLVAPYGCSVEDSKALWKISEEKTKVKHLD